MKETIEAIYENGVFRPIGRLTPSGKRSFVEGQRIILIVKDSKDESSDAEETKETKQYDFSDLVGKLSWSGDAVAEQKRLRDEWE